MTEELKRFEKWWDAGDDIPNDGPYTPDTPIQFAWAGWQAALAQPAPVQEPVAWTLLLVGEHNGIIGKAGDKFLGHPEHYQRVDVYTAPPAAAQREWVGLTDEERQDIALEVPMDAVCITEAKLKEKNT